MPSHNVAKLNGILLQVENDASNSFTNTKYLTIKLFKEVTNSQSVKELLRKNPEI